MREQERESWQKLIESNRMKTKYPERGRETQGGQGVTRGDGHTEQGWAEPSARPPRRRRNVAQTCTSEDVQQAQDWEPGCSPSAEPGLSSPIQNLTPMSDAPHPSTDLACGRWSPSGAALGVVLKESVEESIPASKPLPCDLPHLQPAGGAGRSAGLRVRNSSF